MKPAITPWEFAAEFAYGEMNQNLTDQEAFCLAARITSGKRIWWRNPGVLKNV